MRTLPSLRIYLLVLATLSMHNVLAGTSATATVGKSCLDAACVDSGVPVEFDIGISTLFNTTGVQGLLSSGEKLSVDMFLSESEEVTIFEELDLSLWAEPTFSAVSMNWEAPVVNCLAIGGGSPLSRCTAVFDEIGRGNLADFIVSNTIVPIPAAAWLFGSGLLGLISIARKKPA